MDYHATNTGSTKKILRCLKTYGTSYVRNEPFEASLYSQLPQISLRSLEIRMFKLSSKRPFILNKGEKYSNSDNTADLRKLHR